MCSWCWGFEPVRQELFYLLESEVEIQRLVGGLAPDSNEPMPHEMQESLKGTWRKIEQAIPDTKFNFDFWDKCKPRRSTYPANRAVIAARAQGREYDSIMTLAIQKAYYQQAMNPSDDIVLILLAEKIGLNLQQFKQDLNSRETNARMLEEVKLTRQLGMNSFPSLAVITKHEEQQKVIPVKLNYNDSSVMISEVRSILKRLS